MKHTEITQIGKFICSLILSLIGLQSISSAQQYDMLLKGGTVIDPKNNLNGLSDVAISGGKIAKVASNIPPSSSKRVVDVTGLYVVPGLIDLHGHLYAGTLRGAHASGQYSIWPDGHSFRYGTTTWVDAGSSGYRNFRDFYNGVIALSRTRVLAWLNIVGLGLSGTALSQNVEDMNVDSAAALAKLYPKTIMGFKTVQWQGKSWVNVDRALEAGRKTDLPVYIDFGKFWPEDRPYQELVLKKLRPGDISTHMYEYQGVNIVPLFDDKGKLLPFLAEARKRGVIFDLGHGLGNFRFFNVVPAVKQGWWPNSISTDLHSESMNQAAKGMTNIMSKMMNMGIPLVEIIKMSTWNPAQEINQLDLGNLTPGVGADVAVLRLEKGHFGFLDIRNVRMTGSEKLVCELTLRDGKVEWDLNGIAAAKEYVMPGSNLFVPESDVKYKSPNQYQTVESVSK